MRVEGGVLPDILIGDVSAFLGGYDVHGCDVEVTLAGLVWLHREEVLHELAAVAVELVRLVCCVALGYEEQVHFVLHVSGCEQGCDCKVRGGLAADEGIFRVYAARENLAELPCGFYPF